MKLKALKYHYYDNGLRQPGQIYMADKAHGEPAVRNGLCVEIKQLTREDKIKTKQHPKTKKGVLKKK